MKARLSSGGRHDLAAIALALATFTLVGAAAWSFGGAETPHTQTAATSGRGAG